VIPLIDTKAFQSLGFKNQLGFASAIFPAATHTRKQHCLGAYERTKRLMEMWKKYGFVNEKEAKNLPIYALYHDVGHGPFSHVTEGLGSVDHNERGMSLFENLKDVFEKSGFDYHFIHDMFSRKNSLYLGVSDKNLGMEKLDYLERDAYYTIGERPGMEFLTHHIYFINNKIVIDQSAVDAAKDVQDFYIKMYKHVYTRKKAAIIQRLIEKMTHILMKDGLDESTLFDLTDYGLFGKFESSNNKILKSHYNNFMMGDFPKLALEFVYEDIEISLDEIKTIKRKGIEPKFFDKLVVSNKFKDVDFLEKLENEIGEIAEVPGNNIFLIPASKRRFEPDDLNVYTQEGSIKKISNIYPNHFKAMKEYGRSHMSFRIAVHEDYRRKIFNKSEEIKKYIIDLASNIL
ncbi:MAG: HD domain-containing protein, partial [Candidatus Paceibacterota bacterium]